MWPRMWLYCRVLCLERIISFLLYTIEAQISFPLGGVTYWQPGSLVKLPWTYNFPTNDIFFVSISFIKSGSNNSVALAEGTRGASLTALVPSSFTIEGQATLVFKNASLGHNGTYSLAVLLKSNTLQKSEVLVVILLQPTANVNCSPLITLKEGDNFNCSCEGTGGNPPAIALWYKGNVNISGPGYLQEILSLKNVSRNTVGNYSCFVKSYNLTDSKQVEVQVLLKPTAVINCSTNVTVKEGDNVECLCYGIGGNPLPTASWYKNGKKVTGSGYLKKTLSLKSISKENAGNYSCIVNNTVFEDVKQIKIHVQLKPTAVINCSTNVTVKEGDNVECLCYGISGNPLPTASWYKNGKKVNGSGSLKKTLSLKSISKENAGNYSCIVNNAVFEDVKQIEIKVQYKPINIVLQSGNENKYIAVVGENVTITCKAEGVPAPNYIILINGTPLSTTDVVNGVTTIKSVQRSDNGQYDCIANNFLGNTNASFNLIVHERPTAEINCSSPFTVKEGDNFKCLCYSSAGYPPPNVTWYNRRGDKVDETESLNKTLLLKNITKEEAANYSCIVKSLDLDDTKQIKLQVQYKPKIVSFKSGQENNTVPVGGNVTITCKAVAFPPLNYTIYHNGVRLTDVVNGVKTIKSIDHNDGGRYECMAINSLGNVYASFNLIVQGKPSNIKFCFTKPNDEDITLTCKANSVPPPTYTIALNGKTLTNVVEGTTTIRNFREHGIGVYSCEAENIVGKDSIVLLAAKGDSNSDTKWYFIVIALVCGMFIGMILLYAILSLRQRIKNKQDVSKPVHNYDTPETNPEGAADNSAYQELDLRNKDPENSYQALRMNTRRRINNETKIEDEANYQELDKVREKENSYQSLNRV